MQAKPHQIKTKIGERLASVRNPELYNVSSQEEFYNLFKNWKVRALTQVMTETQAPALHAYMDYLEKTMIAERYENELGAAAYERVGAIKPDMK